MRRTALPVMTILLGLLAVTAGVVAGRPTSTPEPRGQTTVDPGDPAGVDAVASGEGRFLREGPLTGFASCPAMLSHLREEALRRVEPWGLPGSAHVGMFGGAEGSFEAAAGSDAVADDRAAAAAAPAAPGSFTDTNVQEPGVDESDLVDTDGRLLVTLVEDALHVVDVSGPEPRLLDTLALEQYASGLMLVEDVVVLLGGGDGGVRPLPLVDTAVVPYAPTTTLTLVDVGDPGDVRVTRTLTVDGQVVSARMVGTQLFVAISSTPAGLVFEPPRGSGLRGEQDALAANRAVIERSDVDDWLPAFTLTDPDGATSEPARLVGCEDVARPEEFGGLSFSTLLHVDVADRVLAPASSAAVISSSQTISATSSRLYMTTSRWVDDVEPARGSAAQTTTAIHAFALPAGSADGVRHVASGEVEGHLLDQFAISPYDGHVRVATTTQPTGGAGFDEGSISSSAVTVLAEEAGRLEQVGRVDGLGLDEQIYAVRMIGDVGYVVTFRQIDPLYTLDLSDPTAPSVEGELKITGYSSYLHPIGPDRVVGIGQEATEQGQPLGTQVSVFDVGAPADPTRLGQVVLESATSEAEYDHHAFLHVPARVGGTEMDSVVVPLEVHDWRAVEQAGGEPGPSDVFVGAVVLSVDPVSGAVAERGRVSHAPADAGPDSAHRAGIRRAVVTDGRLLTVSTRGIQVDDLSSLQRLGRLSW